MLEHGTSLARVRYASNSTNVEGWGLYSEYLVKPYMPAEGQLVSLDLRLQRAARAFLDPEPQAGKIQPEDVYRVMEHDVFLSHAFAQEEAERFTYRMPRQANKLGLRLHNINRSPQRHGSRPQPRIQPGKISRLAPGLFSPDLMRDAVMDSFVPNQRAAAH